MKQIWLPLHYRRFNGSIACGTRSTRIDVTSLEKHVTCKNCLKVLRAQK